MAIRDRIKSLRRVRAGDLKPSPKNWRSHPDSQRAALQGILAEVGYADACLARELEDGSLELVDGHLRQDLDPDQLLPVLVLDITEAEAAKLLAVLDPLAGMAEANEEALASLLAEIETESTGLEEMLKGLEMGIGYQHEGGTNDPDVEWEGMPEFEQENITGIKAIIHFETEENQMAFEELVGQKIPKNTHAIWFPAKPQANLKGTQYVHDA